MKTLKLDADTRNLKTCVCKNYDRIELFSAYWPDIFDSVKDEEDWPVTAVCRTCKTGWAVEYGTVYMVGAGLPVALNREILQNADDNSNTERRSI